MHAEPISLSAGLVLPASIMGKRKASTAALGGSKHKLKTLGQGSVLPSVDSERSGAAIPDDAEAAPPARPRTLAALTAGANNATGCCAGAATRGSVAWRFEAFLAEHLDAISLVLLPGTYSVFLAFSGVL